MACVCFFSDDRLDAKLMVKGYEDQFWIGVGIFYSFVKTLLILFFDY